MMERTATTLKPRASEGALNLRFRTRLVRSPFHGTLYESELTSQRALQPAEFGWCETLDTSACAPVLLSWSQHYKLLAQLVRLARAHIPDDPLLLLRHHAPNHVIPLPPELLAADVLLTDEPGIALAALHADDTRSVLTIEDDLRRDGCETGTNSVVLTLYRAPDEHCFAEFLRTTPFGVAANDLDPDTVERLP
jgi:hypothetical protein